MSKYWDLSSLKMMDKTAEKILKDLTGGKTVLNMNKHSCSSYKYPEFIVGKNYWIDISGHIIEPQKFRLCKITYIRSGIIFYIEIKNPKKEYNMEEFCLNHLFCSPEEIDVDLDPDYYEVRDFCGKMKVNYKGKLKN